MPYLSNKGEMVISFKGLNESLKGLEIAKKNWMEILNKEQSDIVKHRMKQDILWFETTLSRYKLLGYLSSYYKLRFIKEKQSMAKNALSLAKTELEFLLSQPNFSDAMSPGLLQLQILEPYKKFIYKIAF